MSVLIVEADIEPAVLGTGDPAREGALLLASMFRGAMLPERLRLCACPNPRMGVPGRESGRGTLRGDRGVGEALCRFADRGLGEAIDFGELGTEWGAGD